MGRESIDNEIARLAYDLWERGGYMPGRELENWLEAEQIVLMKQKGKRPLKKKENNPSMLERMPVELKKASSRETTKESREKKGTKKTAAKEISSKKHGRASKMNS